MAAQSDFAKLSYQTHKSGYGDYAHDGPKADHARAWLDEGCINTWRFNRMYALADPLLASHQGARWLTVGDGRYGMDAMYLKAHGARALATDISTTLFAEAKAQGLIDDFRKENAEALSFPDASFDFVFCKESYHHIARPMHALREMLRRPTHYHDFEVAGNCVYSISRREMHKVALGLRLRTVAFQDRKSVV